MKLKPEYVKGMRISRCAANGEPYLTITIPERLIRRGNKDMHGLAGTDFWEINRVNGSVVLETDERDPRVIVDLVNRCKCPLALEVLESQGQAVDSHDRAINISPGDLHELSRGAIDVKDRLKERRKVYTVTFEDAQEGLARLESLDPRFGQSSNPFYKPDGYVNDVFDVIDGARRYSEDPVSNPQQEDVDFKIYNDNMTIPYGQPATLNFNGVIFTVAPGQRAEEAYDAAQETRSRAAAMGGEMKPGTRPIAADDSPG